MRFLHLGSRETASRFADRRSHHRPVVHFLVPNAIGSPSALPPRDQVGPWSPAVPAEDRLFPDGMRIPVVAVRSDRDARVERPDTPPAPADPR